MEETAVVIVRTFITFITLLIYTRMLGKQQMSNLSFFDYITGITIGSIGAGLATDLTGKAWGHWVGLSTFILITFLLQMITLKNRRLSKMVDSEAIIVVQDGKILEGNLNKVRVKKDELMILLRQKAVFDLTQVEYALLESNGSLSILLKQQYRPLTLKDLHIHTRKLHLTTEVIYDGEVLTQNLKEREKDEGWLRAELKKRDVESLDDITYAAILPDNSLYIDLKQDSLKDHADISDYDNQD